MDAQVEGVDGHIMDAVQGGLTLQRHLLPEAFSPDIVRRIPPALLPPDDVDLTP